MISSPLNSPTSSQAVLRPTSDGLCRTEPLTTSGKRIQMAKMLILIILPVLGLWGYSVTLLIEMINTRMDGLAVFQSLGFSLSLGQLVHRLQRERDMSVLYLSAIGPDTKTFLLQEYLNTDRAIENLTSWPVDLDRNQRKEFRTKQSMIMYLAKHRQELNADVNRINDELAFYTNVIDIFIIWIHDSIKEFKFAKVWRMFVAYQKITAAKEDLGIERALGTLYFANGGFPNQDVFESYNRKVHAFRTTYSSARRYSDYVQYLSFYDSEATNSNLSDTIYEFRYDIQHSLPGQNKNNTDISRATSWFNNCTVLLDLMLELQSILGNISQATVSDVIDKAMTSITVYIAVLVIVIAICPVIIYLTENMTSSIQRYALVLVDKTKELKLEKKKTDSLLYQMVPKPVADRLKKYKGVDAQYFKSVTILFSDICGFSRITLILEPMNIVQLLNALYEAIDELLNERDVYKVETINDSYMVVSGLPELNGNRHSAVIGEFALSLLEMMKEHRFDHIQTQVIALRIGINTGPCMAGIVGSAMLRYCLFGDTVNTASRMKSYSSANKIHVSPSTQMALNAHGSFKIEKRGMVTIKGKGEMMTYWLVGRKHTSEACITDNMVNIREISDVTHVSRSETSISGDNTDSQQVNPHPNTPDIGHGSSSGQK